MSNLYINFNHNFFLHQSIHIFLPADRGTVTYFSIALVSLASFLNIYAPPISTPDSIVLALNFLFVPDVVLVIHISFWVSVCLLPTTPILNHKGVTSFVFKIYYPYLWSCRIQCFFVLSLLSSKIFSLKIIVSLFLVTSGTGCR